MDGPALGTVSAERGRGGGEGGGEVVEASDAPALGIVSLAVGAPATPRRLRVKVCVQCSVKQRESESGGRGADGKMHMIFSKKKHR